MTSVESELGVALQRFSLASDRKKGTAKSWRLSITGETLELPDHPYTQSICIDTASLRQQHARPAPFPTVAWAMDIDRLVQ